MTEYGLHIDSILIILFHPILAVYDHILTVFWLYIDRMKKFHQIHSFGHHLLGSRLKRVSASTIEVFKFKWTAASAAVLIGFRRRFQENFKLCSCFLEKSGIFHISQICWSTKVHLIWSLCRLFWRENIVNNGKFWELFLRGAIPKSKCQKSDRMTKCF